MTLNLKSNAIWALAEIILSALVTFFLYRLVVRNLGPGSLGVWSIVIASTSLARVADPGVSAGLGRFISAAWAQEDRKETKEYFLVALATTSVFYVALCGLLYWPLLWALPFAVTGDNLDTARALAPFALLSFLLSNINGLVQGAVGGVQRSDVKSRIAIATSLLQLGASMALIPTQGLLALALGQILQFMVAIVAGYLWFTRHIGCPVVPSMRFDRMKFARLWSFGVKLQLASLLSFLYDPLGKFVISHLAGVETLGVFEMAQKFIVMTRQLVVGPTSVLMPAFSHLNSSAPQEVSPLYQRALTASVALGGPLLGLAALFSPLVSLLWLNHVDMRFVAFVWIMALGWFVSLLQAPSYLHAVAVGRLKWNVVGAIVTLALTPLLAFSVGRMIGPVGIVASVVGALTIGMVTTHVNNCRAASFPVWPSNAAMIAFLHGSLARVVPGAMKR